MLVRMWTSRDLASQERAGAQLSKLHRAREVHATITPAIEQCDTECVGIRIDACLSFGAKFVLVFNAKAVWRGGLCRSQVATVMTPERIGLEYLSLCALMRTSWLWC